MHGTATKRLQSFKGESTSETGTGKTIILKWVSKDIEGRMRTGFVWLRTGYYGRLF
jgi:hypothetical protein